MEELTSTKKNLIRHNWSVEDHGEYRRKLSRESQRKRRSGAREKGLCIMCVKSPREFGRSTCQKCYERVLIWQYKKRKERTKE